MRIPRQQSIYTAVRTGSEILGLLIRFSQLSDSFLFFSVWATEACWPCPREAVNKQELPFKKLDEITSLLYRSSWGEGKEIHLEECCELGSWVSLNVDIILTGPSFLLTANHPVKWPLSLVKLTPTCSNRLIQILKKTLDRCHWSGGEPVTGDRHPFPFQCISVQKETKLSCCAGLKTWKQVKCFPSHHSRPCLFTGDMLSQGMGHFIHPIYLSTGRNRKRVRGRSFPLKTRETSACEKSPPRSFC